MTQDQRRQFEELWPRLATRLDARLARRNVPPAMRDDVVQETGVRLLEMWERVDPDRKVWPLAVTIASNLLWDDVNRRREVAAPIADSPAPHDVEDAALARFELATVSRAMRLLTSTQRDALLAEVGASDIATRVSPDALKMLRMRARRRLSALVQRVPVVLWFRFRTAAVELVRTGEAPAALAGLAIYAAILLTPLSSLPRAPLAPGRPDLRAPSVRTATDTSERNATASSSRREVSSGSFLEDATGGRRTSVPSRETRPPNERPPESGGTAPQPPNAHSRGRLGRTGPVSARNSVTIRPRGNRPQGSTSCILPRRDGRRTTLSCEVHTSKASVRVRVRIHQ